MSRLARRYLQLLADDARKNGNGGVAELIELAVEEVASEGGSGSPHPTLLRHLFDIAKPSARILRELGKIGQANALEERLLAVEESARSNEDLVSIPASVWRRVKEATGYTFETDEQVADAIEGLLKETKSAIPYAHALEDFAAAVAGVVGVALDKHFVPTEGWRGLVQEAKERLESERQQRLLSTGSLVEIRATLGELDALGPIEEPFTTSEAIREIARERDSLNEIQAEWRTEANRLLLENDRLNTELDAMAQRAVCSEVFADETVRIADATFPIAAADEPLPEELRFLAPEEPESSAELNTEPKHGGGQVASQPIAPEPVESDPQVSPVAPQASQPTWEAKPFREESPEEMKARLGVREPAEPKRVVMVQAGPKVPTLDDRIEAIRRLAENEAKADIASALGLKGANVVHGLTMNDKQRIARVRQAAPHDRAGVLEQIRAELAPKVAANV